MNKVDIVMLLYSGAMSVDVAESMVEAFLDSENAAEIENALGFSRVEWTAFCQGASLSDIATWRYAQWPTVCLKCGGNIVVENFGWKVVENEGAVGLKHIVCPRST